jgi:hypothetical protein
VAVGRRLARARRPGAATSCAAERASWASTSPRRSISAETLVERARRDRAPYEQWVADGHLITTPGNRIDQDAILDTIVTTARSLQLEVRHVGVDPWNAGNIEKDLQEAGFNVVEVPQTFAHLSAPSKEFEAEVLDAAADAGGNPLMAWMVSNAVVQRDGKDNIQPIKKNSRGRIDGVVASLIAKALVLKAPDQQPSVYLTRGGRVSVLAPERYTLMDILGRLLGGDDLRAGVPGPTSDYWYGPVGTMTDAGVRVDVEQRRRSARGIAAATSSRPCSRCCRCRCS